MKKLIATALACSLASSAFAHTNATSLIAAYKRAKGNDPVYLAAEQQWMADKERFPQGLALQMPVIAAAFSTTGNHRLIKHGIIQNLNQLPPNRYNTRSWSLTITQPVVNFANWATLKQASSQVKAATARYLDAQQDLIVRTARAYLSVLLARDVLSYDQAELNATKLQLHESHRRYKAGLNAITAIHQAKSQFQKVASQVEGSKMSLENARRDLERITGDYYSHLRPLRRTIPLVRPNPTNLKSWEDAANSYNYALQAARYDMLAAKDTVAINFAGHLPTVDVVASANRNFDNGGTVVNPITQDFRSDQVNRSVSLQMQLPIFQGGAVISRTHQARHEYYRSVELVRVSLRNARMLVQQNYSNILKGITKLRIDRRAVATARASLMSTREAYDVGTSTFIDLLVMQRDLFQAQRTYATDEFNYLMAILDLKKAAGTLCVKDLEAINRLLVVNHH